MNYMPDMAYFVVSRPAKGCMTSLRAHIEGLIPYARARAEGEQIWFIGGDTFVTIELIPSTAYRRVQLARSDGSFGPDDPVVELCSGPNHDASYFPLFHDVALALLQFPGVRRLGNSPGTLDAMQPHFERVAARLAALITDEEYNLSLRTAATAAMLRVTRAFPAISMTPPLLPWLVEGLTQDDDAAVTTLVDKLLALRLPEAVPRLKAALLDPEEAHHLPRLLSIFARIAEGAPGDPDDLRRATSDDFWQRWIARYALACHGDPGPLLAGLGDRDEVFDLLCRADMAFFLAQIEDQPDFTARLDAYVDRDMNDNERVEALIAAIAALCRRAASTWPRAVGQEHWSAALIRLHGGPEAHARAIVEALWPAEAPPP